MSARNTRTPPDNLQAKRRTKAVKKKRGGPLRAFIRVKTLGQRGKADFKAVAEVFRREKAENSADYQTAIAMAEAHREASRLGLHRSGPIFGSNSRAVKKTLLKNSHEAFWRRTRALDADQRAVSIGDHVLRQGLCLRSSLSAARAAVRFDAAKERQRLEEMMQSLVAYRSTQGAEVVRQVVQAVPELAQFSLKAEPLGPFACVEVQPPQPDEVAGSLAWAHASSASNLSASLSRAWEQAHATLWQASCPAVEETAGQEESPCLAAGICLCSEAGKRLKLLGGRLLAAMKRIFPKGSQNRRLLLDGQVVVRLMGEPAEDASYEDMLADSTEMVDEWLHIGLMYLSPFRPTFLRVKETMVPDEVPATNGRVYVQAGLSLCRGRKSVQNALRTEREANTWCIAFGMIPFARYHELLFLTRSKFWYPHSHVSGDRGGHCLLPCLGEGGDLPSHLCALLQDGGVLASNPDVCPGAPAACAIGQCRSIPVAPAAATEEEPLPAQEEEGRR